MDAAKYLNKLIAEREFGVQKHTFEWCVHKAAKKYYYEYNTMRQIFYDKEIHRLITAEEKGVSNAQQRLNFEK